MTDDELNFDLDAILGNESTVAHFQPIVSIKKQRIIGSEALCRGYCDTSDRIIPPLHLFDAASKANRVHELDQLCRKKALSGFGEYYTKNQDQLLFINMDISSLDETNYDDESFLRQVYDSRIPPSNIVIEIVESKCRDISLLTKIIQYYRYYNFLIAVDDVGSGYSNMDRIAIIRPNIIKAYIELIDNIDTNFYKQEILKSLAVLARNIGALLLAEGVETEEQGIRSVQLGAELLQGFHLAKPGADITGVHSTVEKTLGVMSEKYRREESGRLRKLKERNDLYKLSARIISDTVSSLPFADFSGYMKRSIEEFSFIEAMYIMDLKGSQITETILNGHRPLSGSTLFKPALKGDSHTLKDYYYFLVSTESEMFTTDAYISLATGNLCRTISFLFSHIGGSQFILCLDVIE